MNRKIVIISMILACTVNLSHAQDPFGRHRASFPTLKTDGTVVDTDGITLGFITADGKISDVTGKTLGTIAKTGDVTMANSNGVIGVIRKDRSFKDIDGIVVTLADDDALMIQGRPVGFVDKHHLNKAYASVLYYFFSTEKENADTIDDFQ
jgi:hypothetical protein